MIKLNTADKIPELIEALIETLKILQEAVESKQQIQSEKPVYKRWRDEKGGMYFFLDDAGEVTGTTEAYTRSDNFRYDIGNYFQTEEQTEAYRKHMLYTQKLHDAAKQAWLDAGTVMDWSDGTQYKWFIGFRHKETRIDCGHSQTIQSTREIYFPSEESCLNAYTNILGDDLKWYMTYERGGVL